ncbi:unnamed protein product [Schistocephalus solidus]|uniref:DDE_Tnp_IS1595 domain-containing protein n=1 Tax=Schistocephalus solidus TaxID=70667 RepID=A0A183SKB0_SCHSO|nr:unnamed protein product [Schistocephalus solidus]
MKRAGGELLARHISAPVTCRHATRANGPCFRAISHSLHRCHVADALPQLILSGGSSQSTNHVERMWGAEKLLNFPAHLPP